MSILNKIINHKKSELEIISKITPIEQLKSSQRLFQIRDFKSTFLQESISIIAEIKFKSPSAGIISENQSPTTIAKLYEKNGASAISVLTDNYYFGGNLNYIHQVKAHSNLPVLRKDFIISEYQIWESFHAGADAILLISDALDFSKLKDLYQLANELGMAILVESHSEDSLDNALQLNPEILGINCRNLNTMETDLKWFENCIHKLNSIKFKIAESGIHTTSDIDYIQNLGYSGALIGTSLMKTGNPGNALAELLNRVPA